MRYLSMIRINEKRGQAPSEQLMQDMGKLIEEMTRSGALISTAGLRPTSEGVRELTRRFLRVHGNEWDLECEVRQLDGPEFGVQASG